LSRPGSAGASRSGLARAEWLRESLTPVSVAPAEAVQPPQADKWTISPLSPPRPLRVLITGLRGNRAECRIVRVALLCAAIQGFSIDRHQRRIEEQPDHQVRICNVKFAERDEISASFRDGLVCAALVEAIVGYDGPAEQALEPGIVERRNRGAGRIAFDGMEIGRGPFPKVVRRRSRTEFADRCRRCRSGHSAPKYARPCGPRQRRR